jgi:hypothetical protein
MNCKDTLLSIFQYLQGKDLLNCNLVCKRWYEIGSDNHLWYECLRRSIPKEIVAKNDPRFIYRRNIHYKLFYLSYFSHRYQFMLGKDIKELWKEFLSDDYWIGKILAPLTFLPVLLIITKNIVVALIVIQNKTFLFHTDSHRQKLIFSDLPSRSIRRHHLIKGRS